MISNIPYIAGGVMVILAVLYRLLSGKGEKPAASAAKTEVKSAQDMAADAKKKIMSEMGKKGAARSAEVRRAKKAQKAKENAEQENEE